MSIQAFPLIQLILAYRLQFAEVDESEISKTSQKELIDALAEWLGYATQAHTLRVPASNDQF